jgi:hypothetical protein
MALRAARNHIPYDLLGPRRAEFAHVCFDKDGLCCTCAKIVADPVTDCRLSVNALYLLTEDHFWKKIGGGLAGALSACSGWRYDIAASLGRAGLQAREGCGWLVGRLQLVAIEIDDCL